MTPPATASENDQILRSEDGVWTVDRHNLYVDIPQLLQVSALADTSENRTLAIALVRALTRQAYPDAVLHITE